MREPVAALYLLCRLRAAQTRKSFDSVQSSGWQSLRPRTSTPSGGGFWCFLAQIMPECAAIQTVLRRQAMTPWQRFLIISSSSTLALALFPAPSKSEAIRPFCAAAEKDVSSDSRLSEAVKVVFGSPEYSSQNEECIYPLQVLRYSDADVLFASGNAPGELCSSASSISPRSAARMAALAASVQS